MLLTVSFLALVCVCVMTLSRRLGTLWTATCVWFGMYSGGVACIRQGFWVGLKLRQRAAVGESEKWGAHEESSLCALERKKSSVAIVELNFLPSGKLSLHPRKHSGEATPMCRSVCFRERPIPSAPAIFCVGVLPLAATGQ